MEELKIFGYSLSNSFYKEETHENQGKGPKAWVDILHERLGIVSDPKYRGIPMCSEERILFNLKKIKKIDLAIIIHSQPVFWFVHADTRDLRVMNENDLDDFFAVTLKNRGSNTYALIKHRGDDQGHYNYTLEYVREVFEFQQDYMLSDDLIRNRFHGALVLIDQYCNAKKIPVIHCIDEKNIPSWFKFSSGLVDTEVRKLAKNYGISYSLSVNGVSEEGNIKIADRLENLINQLLDKK